MPCHRQLKRVAVLAVLAVGAPAGARAQAGEAVPARDTAYAVHNFFREHRNNGLKASSISLASVAGAYFDVAHGHRIGLVSGLLSLNSVVGAVVGLHWVSRFSESREAGVVQLYQQGWPLPAGIRRRLRPKHFRVMN